MRRKVKGKLYYLGRDAKSRMRNYNRKKSVFEQLPYAKTYSGHDQELYERVCKMLLSDQVIINPIQELVDKKVYSSLSLEAKQRYIFDLSEKYKAMKIRFEREHGGYVANIV